jgi:hypothetical protein
LGWGREKLVSGGRVRARRRRKFTLAPNPNAQQKKASEQ